MRGRVLPAILALAIGGSALATAAHRREPVAAPAPTPHERKTAASVAVRVPTPTPKSTLPPIPVRHVRTPRGLEPFADCDALVRSRRDEALKAVGPSGLPT